MLIGHQIKKTEEAQCRICYFCLIPAGPAISWKTRKQPTVALSTCESEYMALAETTQVALFLKKLQLDLKELLGMTKVQLL